MTKREYLEHVRDWFTRTQKFGFDRYFKKCVYRHPIDPDCRCAVGCSIPDDAYDPGMEGGTIFALVGEVRGVAAPQRIYITSNAAVAWLSEIDDDLVSVMGDVQYRHDKLADAGAMDEFLAYVNSKLAALDE